MPPDLDLKEIETLKRRLSTEWKDRDDDIVRALREQVEHKSYLVSNPATEEKCPRYAYPQRIVEYRLIGNSLIIPYRSPQRSRSRRRRR